MGIGDNRKISELTIGDAKRIIVYAVALLLAVVFFGLMVNRILVALLLGVVAGAYLLPLQTFLESKLKAKAGSALVTIALIVIPLLIITAYTWHELSGYPDYIQQQREQIITAISRAFSTYLPIRLESTRAGLEAAFAEAVLRSGESVRGLRSQASLLLVSTTLFFFTVFYVLTQRERIVAYLKLRISGDYLDFYSRLSENIGAALHGALKAVLIDQAIKGLVIFTFNVIFDVPLALVLGIVTFLVGFFPLIGEWAIYIPVSIYLFVFRHDPVSGAIYLIGGILLTLSSSLLLRPRLASGTTRQFSFYWMLLALVAGVYTFGIPGIVLGPAILGFTKSVVDTLFGSVKYKESLLAVEERSEKQKDITQIDSRQAELEPN
ncbi:MAG TPA: AI-2E family transporter [Blastocatellia bacterium]|nr:AI-2E family transporter [Blastocatellia bacterium]